MAIANRFFKTTQGIDFDFAIGAQYVTTVTTIKGLIDSGAHLNDYGVFRQNKSLASPTLVPASSAFSTPVTDMFSVSYVEKIVNGLSIIASTSQLVASTISAEVIAYRAPTLQSTNLSLSAGSIGSLQDIVLKVVETTPANLPFPTWDYTVKKTSTDTVAFTALAALVNAARETEFFTATVNAYVAPVLANATLSSGAVASSAVTSGGSGIYTSGLTNGTGTIALVITGNGTGAAGVANVTNGIVTSTTITAGGSGYSGTVTVAIATQTIQPGITITSTDATRHFRLAIEVVETSANTVDGGSIFTPAFIAVAYAGSGTLAQVVALQNEAHVKRGVGHFYPQEGTTAAEFGLPTDTATAIGGTWDIVVLTGLKTEASPTPLEKHNKKHYIVMAVPAGQGAAVAAIFA